LRVRTGDLLHADCNGIVSIPNEHAALVAELCEPFAEAERIVLRSLQCPNPTLEGYCAAVEEMKEELGRLAERAQSRLADGG
jgi:regulator of RNase E activity RraA